MNMAKWIYCRVSTQTQNFEQQMQDIKAYGIDPEKVDGIVEEKESGGKSYTDRKFQQLLMRCKAGDYIYAASTDRIGRNFVDMIRLMEDAKKRGIIIIACKQGLSLADDNMATKIILSVTAIIDEDERMRIRHRVKNGVDVATAELQKHGQRVTKTGKVQTHWGQAKGCDLTPAWEASALARANAKIAWQEQSKGYQWVMAQLAKGKTRSQIIEEFNELHIQQPDVFCSRQGGPLTKAILSRWASESVAVVL